MENNSPTKSRIPFYRIGLAVLIIGAMAAYVWALMTGNLPETRKLDLTTLAVIAFSIFLSFVLISPGFFQRLKIFEMSGFKLEMLEKVREKQMEQENKLDDIGLILPLLLSKAKQQHLLNIADGKTANYKGSHDGRSELRNLRSAGLLKSKPGTHISQLKDGTEYDVSKLLELTPLGTRWVSRIRANEQAENSQS
jgi:hypothetical protein